MNDKPLVSVGIPTYNRPDGLRRTLECITNQTYMNLEIIISDNCSPDPEVEKICKEFAGKDPRVACTIQPENKGGLFNFRYVLDQATGKYFMWAADDDWWDRSFIEKCIEAFKKSDNIILVAAGCDCYNSKGEYSYSYDILSIVGLKPYERIKRYIENIYHARLRVAALIHGIFYRETMKDIPFFNIIASDCVFMCVIAIRGEIYSIDEVLIRKTRDRGKVYNFGSKLSQRYTYLVLTYYFLKKAFASNELKYFEKVKFIFFLSYLYWKYQKFK